MRLRKKKWALKYLPKLAVWFKNSGKMSEFCSNSFQPYIASYLLNKEKKNPLSWWIYWKILLMKSSAVHQSKTDKFCRLKVKKCKNTSWKWIQFSWSYSNVPPKLGRSWSFTTYLKSWLSLTMGSNCKLRICKSL